MPDILNWLNRSSKSSKFDDWISQYYEALYRHAFWMTGSQEIAQEVVQEAFFQAWLSLGSLKDEEKILPWLLTILRRTVYREQRCQYRNAETTEELKKLDHGAAEPDALPLLEIYAALESLSSKLRDAFLLYHLHGYSYEEVGEQLNIPKGTVMSRISRARETLQKQKDAVDGDKILKFTKIKRGT